MKGKKAIRVVLDVALTLMIVFEMLIQFTGEFLHEVVGFAFFATIVAHILLSMSWVKSTAHVAKTGKLTARRTALAIVGTLLALTVVVLAVSSIAISGLLASAGFVWPIGTYAMWATVHTVSSYVLSALVVVHLAMHWAFLANAFKVPYDPSRRRAISTGVNAVAALGVVALGVTVAGKTLPQVASSVVDRESTGFSGDQLSDVSETAPVQATNEVEVQSSGHGKKSSKSGASSSASASAPGSSGSSSSSAAPQASESTNAADADGSTGATTTTAPSQSTSEGASTSAAICTLCRKQCPLSAPKCDKPYAAGLI